MVAKKRNTLRGKVSARLQDGVSILNQPITAPAEEFPEDPKAYLHQFKETKKEKQILKQNAFMDKIKDSTQNGEFAGISKSSIRRRKRKMRDDLKPKMHDLLTSLQQEDDLREIVASDRNEDNANNMEDVQMHTSKVTRIIKNEKPFTTGEVKIKKNEPNIRNKRGAKLLSMKETERFHKVLNNQEFKQNSFSALRDIIKLQKK